MVGMIQVGITIADMTVEIITAAITTVITTVITAVITTVITTELTMAGILQNQMIFHTLKLKHFEKNPQKTKLNPYQC